VPGDAGLSGAQEKALSLHLLTAALSQTGGSIMSNLESIALRKLEDTGLTVARPDEDVRKRKVVDADGEEVGFVDDLFIDEEERKVRFLRVSSGGFLGLGASKFLIPVDAVTRVEADSVRVDQTRERVAGAPRYAPELVERREYFQSLYGYYGYAPYWTAGYVYPPFPVFPPVPPRPRI
jgi:sporulation protein YlmC with PRC-barrel domain